MIQLSVTRAAQTSVMGMAVPEAGTIFLKVTLTLDNLSKDPAPLTAPLFRLTTDDGLVVNGDPDTIDDPQGCPQTASVAPGASVSCETVFQVAPAATPTRLDYQATDGRTASVAVSSLDRCVTCGKECLDVNSDDPKNCGGCGVNVGLGTCSGGNPVCNAGATPCFAVCVDLSSDPDNCGACGAKTPNGMTCQRGANQCGDETLIACGASCVDPSENGNCGHCGQTCTGSLCQCADQQCTQHGCPAHGTSRQSCNALCGRPGCGNTTTAHYSCPSGQTFMQVTPTCTAAPDSILIAPNNGESCSFVSMDCTCT
jgi:Domain of unknown function (DUF4352)